MNWYEWQEIEKEKDYFKELLAFVDKEYETKTCYPPYDLILNALNKTPYSKVKCVILGQDPYHEPNQAMGLSFSVNKGVAIPRSLQNIYKEISTEFGYPIPDHGDLTYWASQGVLLLNAILTVRKGEAASHQGKGWETFTDDILSFVNEKDTPVVFMLWGNFARSKKSLITNPKHLVLESPHPSPFSADRGFFGNNHFTKCNEFLKKNNLEPIDWQIKD